MAAHELTLVLGVDASGKSTFLHGLEGLGYAVLEPTSSDEARAFKARYLHEPVDAGYVGQRHALFTELNVAFDGLVEARLADSNVATSGGRLVTDVSHAVMHSIVTADPLPLDSIIDKWLEHPQPEPDAVVLLHAPLDVIRQRIMSRQRAGNQDEKFHGFNSPYFLMHYQDALLAVYRRLAKHYPALSIDTGVTPPEAAIEQYRTLMQDTTL